MAVGAAQVTSGAALPPLPSRRLTKAAARTALGGELRVLVRSIQTLESEGVAPPAPSGGFGAAAKSAVPPEKAPPKAAPGAKPAAAKKPAAKPRGRSPAGR